MGVRILLILFLTAGLQAQTVALQVGGTRILSIPEDATIDVSKKGVIDLFHIEGRRWNVTGLKVGFVSINWRSVSARTGQFQVEVTDSLSRLPWVYCGRLGVRCDRKIGIVRGEVADFRAWLSIKHSCSPKTDCRFDASLSRSAMARFTKLIRRFDSEVAVEAIDQSTVYLQVNCAVRGLKKARERLQSLSNDLLAAVPIYCVNQTRPMQYLVKTKLTVESRNESQLRGFGLRGDGGELLSLTKRVSDPSIKSKDQKMQVSIVGEPQGVVKEGDQLELTSGEEFSNVLSEKVSWKHTGISLKAVVTPFKKNLVLVKLSLEFRKPAGGRVSRLISNLVNTKHVVPLSKEVFVARVDLKSESNGESSDFSFGRIPILGPLFRDYSKQSLASKLNVHLKVEPN